jgi:hypothetical protein
MSDQRVPPNPLTLTRPRRRVYTREFFYEGDVYRFSLVRADILDTTAAIAAGAELAEKYITGEPGRGLAPMEFPLMSEEPYCVTEGLCQNAALMERILRPVGDDGEKSLIYNAEELMALALTRTSVYEGLIAFSNELASLENLEKKERTAHPSIMGP